MRVVFTIYSRQIKTNFYLILIVTTNISFNTKFLAATNAPSQNGQSNN